MSADPRDQAAELIESWYRAALTAVEPEAAVRRHLARDGAELIAGDRPVSLPGRLIVVGVGKASVAMARGVEAVCGDLIAEGLVITKDGHAAGPPLARIRVAEAAHPIPDERGVRATREALSLLNGLRPEDVVLALISGGGSALLEAPRPPVTLADMAITTDLLLRAGAPIDDLNAVRTPLSLVKGGGLRRAADPATMITLILSDVLGNDPRVIASGPTVDGLPHGPQALAVLDRYALRGRVPSSVVRALEEQDAVINGDHTRAYTDVLEIVADNSTAVQAAAGAARRDGFASEFVWRERQGEASDLGRSWANLCRATSPTTDVLLGGGEATVTVRGEGIGGRNTEFALAGALELAEQGDHDWVVASLATDGQDGPTDAAGAIAVARTPERARSAGVDPVASLRENDSLRVFEAAGGLVRPGPTGTNVNDLYFAVRLTAISPR